MKYYAMYVRAGYEEKVAAHIRATVPRDIYGVCFSPFRVVKRKRHGEWHEVREKLLAGYLFISTDQIGRLYQMIRTIPSYIRVLGKDTEESAENELTVYPLSEQEERWLLRLTDGGSKDTGVPEDGGIGLSEVTFDENNNVVILSGPLTNMEGYIKKINLHKRVAEVKVEFMNQETVLHLGIDLIRKKE